MSDVRRGAGMGFGLVFGILAAIVAIPLLLCGGIAGLVAVAPDPPALDTQAHDAWGRPDQAVADLPDQRDRAVNRPPADPVSSTPDLSTKISMHEFSQLRDGMTYDDVVAVVGVDGTVSSSFEGGQLSIVTIEWENEGFSYATATFEGGRLSGKTQVNLPAGPTRYSVAAAEIRERDARERREQAQRAAALRIAEQSAQKESAERRMESLSAEGSDRLREALANAGDLASVEEIDAVAERLVAIQESYAGTDAAETAKREADALASLRLALYAADTLGRDPKPQFQQIAEKYPGTIAAKSARQQLDAE